MCNGNLSTILADSMGSNGIGRQTNIAMMRWKNQWTPGIMGHFGRSSPFTDQYALIQVSEILSFTKLPDVGNEHQFTSCFI